MKAKEKITKQRDFILLIILLSILIITGSYFYLNKRQKIVQMEKHEDLRAIAQLKIDQLVRWHKERIADVKVVSNVPFFIREVEEWLPSKSNIKMREEIKGHLSILQKEFGYENIILTSVKGEPIISTSKILHKLDSVTIKNVVTAIDSHKITLTDFYYCKSEKKIHYDIIAPLINNRNVIIAVLIFRIEPHNYLYPLIQSWPIPSKTSETLLIRKEGDSIIYLNDLRFHQGAALNLKFPLTQTYLPAVKAVIGLTGIHEGIDYRGEPVLANIEPVTGTPWFMVAKIDKSEIYEGLYNEVVIVIVFTGLLILLSAFGIMWIYHYGQRNIYRTLWQTQEEYRTTLYSIGDAVITTDVTGKVRYLNNVAEKLTGWKESEARGIPLGKIFHIVNEQTREIVENPVEKILKQGLVVGLANHTILISKNGIEIPIADSGAPIKNEKGQLIGVVIVFRDQTEEALGRKLIDIRLRLFEYAAKNNLHDLLVKTLDEVEAMTKSQIGFYHFLEPDQETITLEAWSTRTQKEFCKTEREGLHYNISEAGAWVDCIYKKRPVIHNDYASLVNKKGIPDGHPAVIRELVVPILRDDKIIAVLGVGNKQTDYTEKDVEIVSYLADVAWEIVEKKRKDEILQQQYLELKESRSEALFLANLIELSSQPIGVSYPNGRLGVINSAFCNLVGYSKSELMTINWLQVLTPPEWIEHEKQHLEELHKTGKPVRYEKEYIRKDGSRVPIELFVHLVRNEKGEPDYYYAFITDLTERKKYEAALKESEIKLRNIVEHATNVFYSHDTNHVLRYLSPQIKKVLGYEVEEALVKWTELTTDNPINEIGFQKTVAAIETGKEQGTYELELLHKDGHKVWAEIRESPIVENGKTVAIVGSLTDITERKRTEEQIRQFQKLEGLGTLAGGIAHDFNNILGIILAYATNMQRHKDDSTKTNQAIETILKAVQRGKALVNQVLTFAQKTEIEFGPVNINEVVMEIMSIINETFPKVFTLSQEIDQNIPNIYADRTQLHQALLNLCLNARDAMPSRGVLTIKTSLVPGINFRERFPDSTISRYICVEVCDTGEGMSRETMDRIFEPFFTTKEKGRGTGLGLAVVYGIVQNHKGFIDVESEIGKGSTFKIYLPVIEVSGSVSKEVEETLLEFKGGNETILVVEDEEGLLIPLKTILMEKGYNVLTANNGIKALEIYKERQKDIALVMTDLGLPGMTGIEECQQIKKLNPDARIIVASGYLDPKMKSEFLKINVQHFLFKPYMFPEVLKTIRAVLDEE